MIAECRVNHDQRRVIVVTDATLEPEDLRWLLDHKARLGAWPYDTLSDERLNTATFTVDVVRALVMQAADLSRRYGRGGRVAIVVDSDANFGMARMYSMLAEDYHVDCRVFRSIAGAEGWLNSAAGGTMA
jgi:hypothetical protein